ARQAPTEETPHSRRSQPCWRTTTHRRAHMKEGKHRVSRVTTRTGDKGESGLADGSRLPKQHARFELMGALDELNSAIGYLVSLIPDAASRPLIEKVQQSL